MGKCPFGALCWLDRAGEFQGRLGTEPAARAEGPNTRLCESRGDRDDLGQRWEGEGEILQKNYGEKTVVLAVFPWYNFRTSVALQKKNRKL